MKSVPFFISGVLVAFFGLGTAAAQLVAPIDIIANHGTVWEVKRAGLDSQAFFAIHNDGDVPDALTGWSCSIAASTALVDADGKPLANLAVPAKSNLILGAKGPHLVLKNPRWPIDHGAIVPCTISFQGAGDLAVMLYATPEPHS